MITLLTKVIIFSKKEKQFKSCFQVSVGFGKTLKRFTCLIVELDEEKRRERQL